jgi:DNA transposition AAA+ family ATPase
MSMTDGGSTHFIVTKEYRRFAEFCDACRRYCYIGLCHGSPGVGKTLSARHYARWDEFEMSQRRHWTTGELPGIAELHTLLYIPEVANTPGGITTKIIGLMASFEWTRHEALDPPSTSGWIPTHGEHLELLIVDEADRLRVQSLEAVRDIYDRHHFGLVLLGMPGIERRLSRYGQLYSRVGFVHAFRTLSSEEVAFVLTHHWEQLGLTFSPTDFTDHEAMASVIRITGGNFRLIQRLFTQVERILEINELRTVTKEVVETAREGLVIGPG